MRFRSYQEFEIHGKISLEKFIDVLRGLDALEESQALLKVRDEALFEERKNKKKHVSKTKSDQKIVIPDLF